MAQSTPKLITFGISHFCEKARWALDWHGIAYEEISWPPGFHMVLAKRYGAKATTVPILIDGEDVIQGSGAIIDWAEQKTRDSAKSLAAEGALDIERRADDVLGVHVRRLAYAEMLPRAPHLAKAELFRNLSGPHNVIGNLMWPVTRQVMMRMYEITPTAASESRSTLERELDWLDSMLRGGGRYLSEDRFSRADLTVASLLAPYARPPEMPTFHDMSVPDTYLEDVERWRDRPVMLWVKSQYEKHRAA
jgi:glutathione S-transferase